MYPRISFVVLLLAVAVFMVSAHLKKKLCDCGLKKYKGIDGCGCKKFVVRPPKPIKFHPHLPKVVCHKVPGPMKFEPIGDVCNCGKTHMKSAGISKPCCSLCDKDYKPACSFCDKNSKHYYHSPPNIFYPPPDHDVHKHSLDLEVVYPHESAVHSFHTGGSLDVHAIDHVGLGHSNYHLAKSLVADPVSLSIALRNAQKRHIKEDAIAFGPLTIPKDGTIIKKGLNVPEDGLLSFDKQVVELKAFGKHGHATVEEEAKEALLLAQEKHHQIELDLEVAGPAHLSYADVGYLPEKHKPGPQFVVAHGGLDAGHVDNDVVFSASVSAHPVPSPKVSAVIAAEVTPAVHYGDYSYHAGGGYAGHTSHSGAAYAHPPPAHSGYAQYNTDYLAAATGYAKAGADYAAHNAPPVGKYDHPDSGSQYAPPVVDGYGYDAATEYYDYEVKDYAYDNHGFAAPPTPAPAPTTPCKASKKSGLVTRLALAAAK